MSLESSGTDEGKQENVLLQGEVDNKCRDSYELSPSSSTSKARVSHGDMHHLDEEAPVELHPTFFDSAVRVSQAETPHQAQMDCSEQDPVDPQPVATASEIMLSQEDALQSEVDMRGEGSDEPCLAPSPRASGITDNQGDALQAGGDSREQGTDELQNSSSTVEIPESGAVVGDMLEHKFLASEVAASQGHLPLGGLDSTSQDSDELLPSSLAADSCVIQEGVVVPPEADIPCNDSDELSASLSEIQILSSVYIF